MADDRKLSYTGIDFQAGIYSDTQGSVGTVAVPAPPGAAQQRNTYRCIALPTGGLGPLPRRATTWTMALPDATVVNRIVGFFTYGPVSNAATSAFPDDAIMGIEYISGGARHFRLIRLAFFDSGGLSTTTLKSFDSTQAAPASLWWGMTNTVSRMAEDTSQPEQPGLPVMVTEWSEAGLGGFKGLWTFPAVSCSTVTAVSTTGIAAQILGHQNRIVAMENLSYTHGGAVGGTFPVVTTNEGIRFTETNQRTSIMTTATERQVFMAEWPNGYGAWGSLSAGELLLIKHQGGAVRVIGDIASPTVVRLGGVPSTQGRMSRAVSTDSGLFYAVNRNGVWNWQGGDTAVKVSAPLDDDFLDTAQNTGFLNVSAVLAEWGNYVVMTGNWLYDTVTRTWWKLESDILDTDSTGANITVQHVSRGGAQGSDSLLYGAPGTASGAGTPDIAWTWSRALAAKNFSWQSQPIQLAADRMVDIREISLRAQGSGTVTVTLTNADGTSQSETFNVTNLTQPQMLRVPTRAQTYGDLIVRVQSDGGATAAPVVYPITIGWRERMQAGIT